MLEMIKVDIFEKALPRENVLCALDFLKEAKLQKEVASVFVMLRKTKTEWRKHREENGATFLHMLGLVNHMDFDKIIELTKCKSEDLGIQDKNGLTAKDYFLLKSWPERILSGLFGDPVFSEMGLGAPSTLLSKGREKEKIEKINKTICELGEERWLSFSFFTWSDLVESQKNGWELFFSAVSKAEKNTENPKINTPGGVEEAFTKKVANEKTASVFLSGIAAAMRNDLAKNDDGELGFWNDEDEEVWRGVEC